MNWDKISLGELCTITKGLTGIQKAIPGDFPMVTTGEERKTHNEFQFDDEAVIVPLVSGTGHGHASIKRIHYQKGKFALGSILCAIIPKDKTVLNAEYLYRFLDLNRENELVARMRGMANVTLPIKEIAKIEIPLPDLVGQIEFIEKYKILENNSHNIDSELKHQLSLVTQLRQAFLQEAMQGKLCPAVEANAETGQQILERIKAEKVHLIKNKKLKKENELPPIKPEEIPFETPENWVWSRLGDLRDFKYSLSYGVLVPGNDLPNGIPFIRVQDLDSASKNQPPSKHIAIDIDKKYSKTRLVGEEILICVVGSIGKVALASDYWIGANIARAICRFMPNASVSRKYIFYCLNSPYTQTFFHNSKKSINPTLNVNVLERTLIPLPSFQIQNSIVTKLEQLMQTCDQLEASINQGHLQNEQLLRQVLKEALEVKEEAV